MFHFTEKRAEEADVGASRHRLNSFVANPICLIGR
jgi:hypothetical protein